MKQSENNMNEKTLSRPGEVQHKKMNREKILKEVKSFALIALVILAFRSVVIEPFRVPTGSMIPTINIGDFVLVNKFAYGWKVPFSHFFSDTPIYVTSFKSPKRGDVIVFKYPKDKSFNYIKRVVAIPGDTLELRDNQLFINDQLIKRVDVDGKKYLEQMVDQYKKMDFDFYKVSMGEKTFVIQLKKENSFAITTVPKITIPKGHYFVMGDNRDHSADSRYWGFVPQHLIKGKALLVWFSMVLPWSKHKFQVRFNRIGTML